jgi:hypothetical protein
MAILNGSQGYETRSQATRRSRLIEQMILRKQSSFGHDLRLIGKFKILEKNGEWRLRAEARAPTAP